MLHLSQKFVFNFLKFAPAFSTSSKHCNLLIDEPKYAWLQELGLKSLNEGVFDGQWRNGKGPVSLKVHV